MQKKNFLRDERAVSEVLGALLIMAIIISASTIYLSIQVPEWTKDYESRHVDVVADDFAELDSLIDGIVLVAKQKGENTTAAGTTPIKMKPDKVPIFGMSPPGSSLNFLPDAETFKISPFVGSGSTPPGPVYNFSWEESTTADFSDTNATRVNVDVTFDEITLSRLGISGDLILNNTITTLSGENQYDNVEITNNSIVHLVPGNYLRLYANSIFIDATSKIIADGRGYVGGAGGQIGSGTGFGAFGYNGSGGGGAGYGGEGGDGGQGEYSENETYIGHGGISYGDNLSTSIDFGSGGGGGGYGEGGQGAPHQGQVGGFGGYGGGAVLLSAQQIAIAGNISAIGDVGGCGYDAKHASGGGGGGSGGTIIIQGNEVNLSSATLSAPGGVGGKGGTYKGSGKYGAGGGGGAGGRIKIFYDNVSRYDNTSLSRSVAGGAGGSKGGTGADDGLNGSNGVFYENETTYISTAPHYSTGYYVSRVNDTGNDTTCYGNMTWDATTDAYTPLVMKVRTSRSSVMEGNASLWDNCPAVANGTDVSGLSSAFDGHRYVQYRAELSTYDTSRSPVLRSARINYSSANPEGGTPVVDMSTGIIKFKSSYLYYPNQELVYEHGAVIQSQGKGEKRTGFVLHRPPITISNESGIPTLRISMVDLTGANYTYAGSTTTSVENTYSDYGSTAGTISFDNLTLNLTTEYPTIWGNWFNKTLEETTLITPYHYTVSVNESAKNVVVEFYGHGDGVELYLEKTAVAVEI